jgi:hypothetical protein
LGAWAGGAAGAGRAYRHPAAAGAGLIPGFLGAAGRPVFEA